MGINQKPVKGKILIGINDLDFQGEVLFTDNGVLIKEEKGSFFVPYSSLTMLYIGEPSWLTEDFTLSKEE